MGAKLAEIVKLFFHLGLVAFGGPAAHIAMIHKEVVDKRKWMDDKHFLDLVGATSLIPGPNSTEMVIHCGYHRGGLAGLVLSGLSFLVPACVLTGILAFFYVKAAEIPNFENWIVGIKPIVMILIFDAVRKLWGKAIKTNDLIFIAIFVLAMGLYGIGEVYALFVGAIVGFGILKIKRSTTVAAIEPVSIFLVFLKIGSVLFGSGYVLISYLQDELVNKRGWLTTAQLADAIGFGQFTPGPVLSTSTFVGYLLSGSQGAILATLGIFLPSFLFVFLLNPLIPKMRASKNFSLLLDCVNAGTIGLMAYALWPLGKVTFSGWAGLINFVIMGVIYFRWPKLNTLWMVVISAMAGALLGQVIPAGF